ncbi:3'-5' exonuclease [Poseidonibacter ostreae]|uniref:3'-5' exonuclease n=1 Tax=Poseidonibacter ostreae TaxID=2654171 RepID=A0A6L4WP06_9BACT|nr:3'-5' exonuclease [Poseidonibacter ostreae]KAB7885165.1 3'-5' exonuclease [Poseidonibacter ostreae]|tara:strand:+ start:10646 stop:11509 length:864 start_codon:yes stop_codon:yes gene_type:complete
MKSKRRIIIKPTFKISNIVDRLLKESIDYDEFLSLLEKANDTFFDNPELEFELLISNGLPLEFDNNNNIFLKTKEASIEEQCFCIVDIETNGSSIKKGHQIIEIGAVKYRNGEIIDSFESLVYAKEIPEYIQEVTNIKPIMLEDAPILESVLKEFKLFLEDDVFIAHDIKFDYNYISDSLEKYDLGKLENRKLCSIDLAKRTIDSPRYGLGFLKEELEIQVDNHHRAYYDALATAHVFSESLNAIDNEKVTNVEKLISFSKSSKTIASIKEKKLKEEALKSKEKEVK